ncbi:hypothetical protein DRB87_02040 [Pandoraea sp. XY-2]|nr:hypothetical protein DRB87_02040 [Pandoraea sp. XY-2]
MMSISAGRSGLALRAGRRAARRETEWARQRGEALAIEHASAFQVGGQPAEIFSTHADALAGDIELFHIVRMQLEGG